ncbi:hypothetical protein NOR_08173 [Metarhizium rileyi]|uniref:Uncharacterized protein n=1 Tax=Metarhizium rileyi (strain RCEF 4871) TaxID=1649241 RepID=A0A166WNQ9_METRR|nr:hypothetical protein NOR_08173 [Metarhizium rileyi RCEF 4871]
MSNEMSTVLTNCGGELQVNLGPNGNGNYKIVDRSGRTIADEPKFVKIQSLGSFINEERKNILKSSVSTKTKRILAGMVAVANTLADGKSFTFTKGFVDVFRTNFIAEMTARILAATVDFLVYRATLGPDDEPKKINDFLTESKVLVWIYTKLTSAKLPGFSREFEGRHVLFPRDHTKGLAILYREWKNAELMAAQAGIVDGLRPFQGFLSEETIRLFCNVPASWDISLHGAKDPARVLAVVPILVPVTEECLGSGNGTDPAAVLKFKGTIPERIQCGFFQAPRTKTGHLETMFRGLRFDPEDEAVRGVYAQLARWGKTVADQTWFARFVEGESLPTIQRAVAVILGVASDDEFGKALGRAFSPNLNDAIRLSANVTQPDGWVQLLAAAQGLSAEAVETNLRGRLEADLISAKKRKESKAFLIARTTLTVQVAHLLGARLEAHLSAPVSTSSADVANVLDIERFNWADDTESEADHDHNDDDRETEAGDAPNPDDA